MILSSDMNIKVGNSTCFSFFSSILHCWKWRWAQ